MGGRVVTTLLESGEEDRCACNDQEGPHPAQARLEDARDPPMDRAAFDHLLVPGVVRHVPDSVRDHQRQVKAERRWTAHPRELPGEKERCQDEEVSLEAVVLA